MTDFTDLVAVVTGGCSGIGAATAGLLTQRGAKVAVLDRDIRPQGQHRALALRCDVRDSDAVDDAVRAVAEELGRIDILVNNAGIGAAGDITANDDDEWHDVFDVNVVAIARVTRAALPHLRTSPSASIVNTCSVVAHVGLPQRALYGASKGAVAALTLAMAVDHVKDGIRVNAVTPGTADTPWVGRLLDQAEDPVQAAHDLRARQPIGRLVTAEEVAHGIAYLASPLSASTTGTLLAIDGGISGLRVG
jgi:2-keto-3-deoxy-L-fuconate dehydrogenase